MQLQWYTMPMWQEIQACNRFQYTATDSSRQLSEVNGMWREKEVLEQGLANCAIYLQALRKKQARNERQLGKIAMLSRKKQKQLQQTKRDLARDIRNRERDEQAFLFNLQACKARLYACSTLMSYDTAPSTRIDSASTPTLCTPTLYSSSSTETTQSSWNGWSDGTDMSPFQTLDSSACYSEQSGAPEGFYRTKHDSATGQDIQLFYSELDPRADDFEPGSAGSPAPRFSRMRAKSI